MTFFNCSCKENCVALSAVASIILGIVAAFLAFTSVIAVTPAFLWVLFGIAVVYLGVVLLTGSLSRRTVRSCICSVLPSFLTGALGTIVLSVILLGIAFGAGSVLGAILVGALIFFFFLLLTTTACLIKCAAECVLDANHFEE